MPAEVENMMWLGITPWHSLGKEIQEDDAYDIKKCIIAAGLDWEVKLCPCYTDVEIESYVKIPSYATVRNIAGSGYEVLGVVGERYEVLQNKDAFNVFQPFLDSKMCRLNTAGSLFNGKKIWVLCEIMTEPLRVTDNDIIRKFLLLSSGHDGLTTVRFGFSPIRVVCNNTLTLAHESNISKLIRTKHTKNLLTNLENIRDIINLIDHDFDATLQQYKRLLAVDVNKSDVERYVKIVLGIDENEPPSTRKFNIINNIVSYFYSSPGNEEKQVRGTMYAAYNAVTYYLSFEYGRTPENRIDSLWFGLNQDLNKKALTIALTEFCK